MIGSTIGSYRILSELGEGGMGVVYRAQEILLDREVALKALHPQITRDESRLQRFKAEAKALARLHHPNIATLFNFFEQDGVYYMVMEFIDGRNLEDVVRQNGALPLRPALEIFNSGLRGFEHAHQRGVIHRDIKPSNLMLTRAGEVKITDFGIARVAGGGKLTQTGKLIGTLEYMSPEQVQGQEQDARSDIYSLGILLFELVTGKMPWTATSDFDIMRSHLEVPAPPARSLIAELPPALDNVITRALNKKPDERFQSVGEMRDELEAIVKELPATKAAVFPLLAPTREASVPVAPAPDASAQTAEPRGLSGATAEARVARAAPGGLLASLTQNKWALPAIGVGGAALLLVGFLVLAARNPQAVTTNAAPTPVPAIIADVEPTPTIAPVEAVVNDKPQDNTSSSGGLGGVELPPTGMEPTQPKADEPDYSNVKLPPDLLNPAPKPTAKPTPKPTAKPKAVVKAKPKTVVRSRPKTKPKPRTVTRPKPKPRTVTRPARKPAPPKRVVKGKPAPKRSNSKDAALRALID